MRLTTAMVDPSYQSEPRYGAYGLSQDVQDRLNAMMDNVVGALRRSIIVVRTRVVMEKGQDILKSLLGPLALAFTTTSDAKASLLSSMSTMEAITNRLDGPSRQEVLLGTLLPSKWYAAAEEVKNGIGAQLAIYKEETMLNLLNAQFSDFVEQLKKLPVPGLEGFPWWGYVLIGVGVLGALYIVPKLLVPVRVSLRGWDPEESLEGYKRSRRRRRR